MRLNGKDFDGSTALLRTDRHLRKIADNVTWFSEFLPLYVPITNIMEVLLNILYKHRLCCHLSGSFVIYIAQLFNKHCSICLYVAKFDTPLLDTLFQGVGSAEFIDLEGFHFEYPSRVPGPCWSILTVTTGFTTSFWSRAFPFIHA
jgi:hypothetical protein